MPIETSSLFGWCSPDAVESTAPAVKRGGEAYLHSVERAGDTWKQLGSHYAGDGSGEMIGAYRNTVPNAEMLADTARVVSTALTEFADGIRCLKIRRTALLERVEAANLRAAQEQGSVCRAEPAYTPQPAATADLLLPAEVAGLAAQYRALEEQTTGRLRSAFRGDGWFLDAATSIPATVLYGTAGTGINATQVRQTAVRDMRAVPLYRQYQTAVQRMRMARGRWKTDLKPTAAFSFDLRPRLSRDFYNHSVWYRNRVRTNPSNWVLPDRLKDLGAAAKGIRIGGTGVLTAVTAGFTIADERKDAYNELLQSNPGWSKEELDRRANIEGGIKGGTKVGIDLTAAATGALIGTAIGGPAGTLIGAGIGIGISVVTSMEFEFLRGRTPKDFAADGVMEAIDNFANGWNKLFGE
ncbi:hypothetical protein ITX31_06830 [Arthrobacter gandavensis]|uniref:hypothetical protein n=1 Tax=Arthrobacter gandavensis TaxID=169960 RepID=UPI0018902327|nr:hypothetical protein [Arthrobacter gandavensis]MBF4993824.1 hypothetical protein [Arthrobacter gandavensis]